VGKKPQRPQSFSWRQTAIRALIRAEIAQHVPFTGIQLLRHETFLRAKTDGMKANARSRRAKRKTLPMFIQTQFHHPLMRLAWEYELRLNTARALLVRAQAFRFS
jgi:hypothetical protein